MKPEQLREIAWRAQRKVPDFTCSDVLAVMYAEALFAEFQKLQAEQEPVAWQCDATHEDDICGEECVVICLTESEMKDYRDESGYVVTPLYAAPPDLTKLQAKQGPVGEVSGNDWSMALLFNDMEPGQLLYAAPPDLAAKVAELEQSLMLTEHKYDVQHALNIAIAGKCDELAAQNQAMHRALVAVKSRLDRNGMSGKQLSEYSLIADAIALPDLSADWLRKHDAQILKASVAEYCSLFMGDSVTQQSEWMLVKAAELEAGK